ncbi:MAG: hypothetical protein IPG89_17810 [Bacteroidetes bacterium]|nr:hypothetical protein [Bacteroidota bacterium]
MYGDGNAIGFEARILDPRLGRWLSIDPLFAKYPDVNPYNSALCNPLYFEDPDGRDLASF